MKQEGKYDRRRFLGSAAMNIAAAKFVAIAAVHVESGRKKASSADLIKPSMKPSFGPLKQLDSGLLNVGYAEAGPANGRPIILLHGWPYDIHSYVDVAPILASKGYRAFVPYLRGFGTTRFLSGKTVRNAAALENPDQVAIVIHNYRWRLGLAEGERKYDDLERHLATGPVITVPTITLEGEANGAPHPDPVRMPKNSPANIRTG
jgi:hypothetical protein